MKKIFMFSVISVMFLTAGDKFILSTKVNEATFADSYNGNNFRIFPGSNLQIETSVNAHPDNSDLFVASAITNFYEGGYTSGFYISTNGGFNWTGTDNIKNSSGATITTLGDPTIVISNDGYFIMTYIAPSPSSGYDLKIGASYSSNNGSSWSNTVYIPGVDTADKPISVTDNVSSGLYSGRTYAAFDELKNFGEEIKGVFFSYTTNNGISWDSSRRITNVDPLFKYRLIADLSVSSDGSVFVLWHSNRKNMGLAKSTNGGVSWVLNNDTAINTDSAIITQSYGDVYLQSVPSMDIDVSGSSRNGWIYTAGVEKSLDKMDVVLNRSTDNGVTWNYKKRINSDSTGSYRIQFMPVIDVDQYGGINVIYYDARNSNANDSFEVFISRSTDGGLNFTDTKISDHKIKFKRPEVAFFSYDGYIGAYTGLTSSENKITPVWYDNSSGVYKAYSTIIELLPEFNIKVFPEGFYNTSSGKLNMKDTVLIYLREDSSPFAITDSAKGVIDSVNFNVMLNFNSFLANGDYFLDVRHRNSIQTWSSLASQYSFGSVVFYDFTNLQSASYGNNSKSVNTKWGIYSGDADQNGFIDLDDILEIYNGVNSFISGYAVQDCNGDYIVDLSDLIIAYNNAQLFITVVTP